MASSEHKAVIDRIEDNTWAVLLIGQEQQEKIIPVEQLPKEAKEGTWLRLRLEEDSIREIIVDAEETSALRSRMASKLDQLRSRQRHFEPINEADTQKQTPKEPETPTAPDEPKAAKKRKVAEEPKIPEGPQSNSPSQDDLDMEWYE